MTDILSDEDPFTVVEATELQRDSADPTEPRMVNANAGSGKTKVLVDRVSRILLQGTDPDKILCLTYTRAAASEMQERLFETFSEWSVASDAELLAALQKLYGRPYSEVTGALPIDRVRTLFASALETPEGLKVMTIHAYCERIIARFPIEAGIMPGFQPLDDAEEAALLADCRERLFKRAQTDAALAESLHHLARAFADSTLDGLLTQAARNYERILEWKAAGGLEAFRAASGLAPEDTPEGFAAQFWAERSPDYLKAYAKLCHEFVGWSKKVGVAIDKALAARSPADAYLRYVDGLVTGEGQITTQTAAKKVNDLDAFLHKDGAEVAKLREEWELIKAARIAQISDAYLRIADVYGADYQRAKHAARRLDFNDLILMTRDLLTRTEVSDWVAYKLDGGVEHVLLDEAQDTSPEQWAIIDAITAPFRQESPDRDGPARTFFAVGDPKQSIYRFQGAAPKLFMNSVRDRAIDGKGVNLRMSFRSTQQVLDAVDTLFIELGGAQAMFEAEDVPEASDQIRHKAFREDDGLVDLWPIVPRSDPLQERDPWDTTPVDAIGEGDPKVRLARQIASQIKDWTAAKSPIFDRDLERLRPVHAGDFLILVQKRIGGLFDALIRELKRAELPVAGADRLVLQEATIVRDLLAVTRFVLLPQDCLSLAEVLKSPLFGLDDHQLFTLAVERGDQSLWQAVQERAPQLASFIQAIRNDAGLAPYDFYARLLDRTGPHGLSYREALFTRLGLEAREALDAFLATALDHQQRRAPSLQRFLQTFTADEVEIKRDKDPAGGEVRVMTVHGAKGLEAPIVILPDTTRAPSKSTSGLLKADESWILAPASKDSTSLTDRYKSDHHAEDVREYMRLLYVAMTRAESRLIVCGAFHGSKGDGYAEGSWYEWMARTMEHLPTKPLKTPACEGDDERTGLRYGKLPSTDAEALTAQSSRTSDLPDWISTPAPKDGVVEEMATPSGLLAKEAPLSRLPGQGRFRRGVLVHRLLEVLPDHPEDRRLPIASAILAKEQEVSDEAAQDILEEVFGVLNNPKFDPVFKEGSRAEVSLAGRVKSLWDGDVFLTAQVDRIHVTNDGVFLVDYKSNRAVPDGVDQVDQGYLAQMAAYRELAREIWPERPVKCGLLWTRASQLMWLPDPVMDDILTQVNALPTSKANIKEGES